MVHHSTSKAILNLPPQGYGTLKSEKQTISFYKTIIRTENAQNNQKVQSCYDCIGYFVPGVRILKIGISTAG